jgi:hypothetical protein
MLKRCGVDPQGGYMVAVTGLSGSVEWLNLTSQFVYWPPQPMNVSATTDMEPASPSALSPSLTQRRSWFPFILSLSKDAPAGGAETETAANRQ